MPRQLYTGVCVLQRDMQATEETCPVAWCEQDFREHLLLLIITTLASTQSCSRWYQISTWTCICECRACIYICECMLIG